MDHFWLAFFWVLYLVMHSILALASSKTYFYSLGIKPQLYRLIYVIIATITLIAILIYSAMIESGYVFIPTKLLKISGLLLAGWGIVISKAAFKSYDTKAFLGLGSLKPEDEFRTDGLLKKVRHPLYSGSILLILGYLLFSPKLTSLISVSIMFIYLLIGIQLEERKLIKAFGDKYIEYKKKTPMLIPRFWK
jgi:protein-S-isoprenylcysteine O-methyltransferase Ste14